jgi:hypothetical protein
MQAVHQPALRRLSQTTILFLLAVLAVGCMAGYALRSLTTASGSSAAQTGQAATAQSAPAPADAQCQWVDQHKGC